jgi:hypothetical protein
MKGYRTIVIAFLTIASGVLAQTDWNVFYDNPKQGMVAVGIGVVMAICRMVTTTPVFQAKHPAEETDKPKVT